MDNTNPKICEVVASWPPHSFVHRHITSMSILGDSFAPVSFTPAHDIPHTRKNEFTGETQNVSIVPRMRRSFGLSSLPGMRSFLSTPWGKRVIQWRNDVMQWRDEQKIFRHFKRVRPDLIHFHWLHLALSLRRFPEILGIPYTVSLRGSEVRVLPLASPETNEQIQHTLEHAAGIHTVSKDLGRDLEYYPFGEIPSTTIYTCVPFPDILPPYPAMDNGVLKLLTVGRLYWTKAYSNLLRALQPLKKSGLSWELTMVGEGPEKERIEFWIRRLGLQGSVRMVGKLDPTDVQSLYRTHHAFLQSSISEGLSNSLTESMANGCPVFATRVGGTTEVIQDGKNGFILHPMKPELWGEKLKLIQDSSLMMRTREAAYLIAKTMFSANNHANQFSAFYQKAITSFHSHTNAFPKNIHNVHQGPPPHDGLLTNVPKILVLGNWEWQWGIDGIIPLIGEIIDRGFKIQCKVMGHGSQKRELLYLCNFLGILQFVDLIEISQEYEESLVEKWRRWADCIIQVHSYENGWVTSGAQEVKFKTFEELEAVLSSHLMSFGEPLICKAT